MKKRIKLMIEYGAWPLWILDKEDFVIDTAMPEEWKSQTTLQKDLDQIQYLYESQFVNNGIEFKYAGFKSESDKAEYSHLIKEVREIIREILPTDWEFIDDADEGKNRILSFT
jgi:hypothetical protein